MDIIPTTRIMEPSIHITTKNTSAIKLHHILKELGVKNNKFFLTIYDTGLMNVDPFDPNLSVEMQARVQAEARNNYWYYVRELVRINVPGGKTRFMFHRGNLAIMFLLQNNINTYAELPRQTTKTGTASCHYGYVWGLKSVNSKTCLLSKDSKSVTDNLKSIKDILNNLPPYMRPLDPKTDTDNVESIISSVKKNIIIARSPAPDQMGAINKARGSSEENDWKDETNFTKFIKLIILNSGPAWGTAARFAAQNNVPYGRLFTSTPGIIGTPEGDYMFQEFLPQCMEFDEKLFYDQPSTEAIKNMVYEGSQNDFVKLKFYYRQLGFGDEYYQKQCRDLANDKATIDREVNLKWAPLSSDNPLDQEDLERIASHVMPPIYTVVLQKVYALKFYKKPDWTKKYIIFVDPSGLTGNDYASIVVVDYEDFSNVATLQSNARNSYSNTTRFTYAIIDIMKNIFKSAILAIERNNMGIAIIDNIITLGDNDIISRMYSSDYEPNAKNAERQYGGGTDARGNKVVSNVNPNTIIYGFQTTEARRALMYGDILQVMLKELYSVVYDQSIIDQLNNIVRTPKGRLDHKNGKHDDMLICYLGALWILMYSKVLYKQFGFKYGEIRPISILDEELVKEEARKKEGEKSFAEYLGDTLVANATGAKIIPQDQRELSRMIEEECIAARNRGVNTMNMDGNEMADFVFGSKSKPETPYSDEEFAYDSSEIYVRERLEEYDKSSDISAMSPYEQQQYIKELNKGLSKDIAKRNAKRNEILRKGREKRTKNIELAREQMARENLVSSALDESIGDLISAWQ